MRHRTAILDIFSTFIQFSEDRFDAWIADRRLVRAMQQQIDQAPVQPDNLGYQEGFWALQWYYQWQQSETSDPGEDRSPQSLATAHLCAYLQEPCYWAAEQVTRRFVNVQYTLADGFQIAIATTNRILKGYNPEYGSNLKAYARTAFGNILRDQLRQQREINICSDWGLLRKLSQIQLQQALLASGFTQTAAPILVWQCFKAICIPDPHKSVRGLSAPREDQLAQMVERYNRLRNQISPTPPALDSLTLTTHLKQSVKAARAYLNPTITSLNQAQSADNQTERLDDLSLPEEETPMDLLLATETYLEQQHRMKQISEVLEVAIATLDLPSQKLLHLYYQETLTQKDIAEQLHIKQYQVSRKLSRVRQQLLLSVAQWAQETLHISIESAVLANVSEVIHEWLQRHAGSNRAPWD